MASCAAHYPPPEVGGILMPSASPNHEVFAQEPAARAASAASLEGAERERRRHREHSPDMPESWRNNSEDVVRPAPRLGRFAGLKLDARPLEPAPIAWPEPDWESADTTFCGVNQFTF